MFQDTILECLVYTCQPRNAGVSCVCWGGAGWSTKVDALGQNALLVSVISLEKH